MYPTLSDLIYGLTGIHIPMGIQSFGLMMAIAFLCAAWTFSLELKRKEKLGLLQAVPQKAIRNKTITIQDVLMNALWGFILGFKFLFVILNYSSCSANPQKVIFSLQGNILGGIICAAIGAFLKYREMQKTKDQKQEEVEELVFPHQMVANITLVVALFGLIGAKVFDFLESPGDFSNILEDPAGALFSGLTVYGGLIFGALGGAWYVKKKGLNLPIMFDAVTPSLMLAYGVGRIGCHIAGDGDWGIDNLRPKPSWMSFLPDWMWAYRYPHNVNNVGIPIPGCEGVHCAILENPVFPAPFYEAVACISLFFVLWAIRKKIKTPAVLFCIYLIFNGVERFFIEKIRINSTYSIFGHAITQAEIISSACIIAGIAGVIYFTRKKKEPLLEPAEK